MASNPRNNVRLAVLIDAENVSSKYIEPLLEQVARLGTASTRRIYGDWTDPQHSRWRSLLNHHALMPVQQFRLTGGKNATDCALIIDAMDLLHAGHFEGFCIVSSDSDFSRLACRIREEGLAAYGFGESKTPLAFIKSCDRFFPLDGLANPTDGPLFGGLPPARANPESNRPVAVATPSNLTGEMGAFLTRVEGNGSSGAKQAEPSIRKPEAIPASVRDKVLIDLARTAYMAVPSEKGWVNLTSFGAQLRLERPGFDPRTYGWKKLGDFVVALGLFEIQKVPSPKNPLSHSWLLRAK
ncbi:NYN domain-containing protein [Tundrisphaera lichenicola]|uniref:NYN domain-containing protein n=1 Tax=Tundrisphaera lichenicola TaxID=2029860 RepID=UPI003EBE8504